MFAAYLNHSKLKCMKLNSISIIVTFILISNSIFGQSVIDASWFPRIGISYTNVTVFADSFPEYDTPSFGLDQEWDFSDLPRDGATEEIAFVDPSQTPFAENFPEASVTKTKITDFGDWYWYYRTTQDTVYEEGWYLVDKFFNFDTLSIIHEKNQAYLMNNGFAVGDSLWTDPSLRFKWTFVGTGKVTTRIEEYENCILLKDEVPGAGVGAVTYRWYHENLAKEVASYVPEESDHPSASVTWIFNYQDELSSMFEIYTKLQLKLSYNRNQLVITNSDENLEVQFILFDMSGAVINQGHETLHNGINYLNLDSLTQLNDGVYSVLIVDKKTGRFLSQKLLIVK